MSIPRSGLITVILLGCSVVAAFALPKEIAARDRWPTVAEQLAADRVPVGSPLAGLIAQNQQFELLQGEAPDTLGLAPWVRVLWRKQHPSTSAPGNPTHGYPLVLKEIHEWLVSHPSLEGPAAVAAKQSAESVAATPGASGKKPKPPRTPTPGVAFETRVSDESGDYSESDIRVNFWSPAHILGMSNAVSRGSALMAIYYSADGGHTWGQTSLPQVGSEDFQSDPAVDWTSDGTGWGVAIAVQTNSGASDPVLKIHAFRSADGGATWTRDGAGPISGDQVDADKELIWVDHGPTSPFKDQIYAAWHNGDPIYVSHRTAGAGGTWSAPLRISGAETTGTGIGSDVKTNQAGNVFVFWPDTGLINADLSWQVQGKILVARSTNGGQSFGKPVKIASTFQSFQSVVPAQSKRAALVYTSGAAFNNGKQNQVYVAWQDLSGAVGCRTPADDPRTNVAATCKTRIWFSRSVDNGSTWSKARMLNDRSGPTDQFNPALAVDQATGVLTLMYYDTYGVARTRTNVWVQSSADGGVTWSAAKRITAGSSDESMTARNQFGDYNGLSGYGGNFYPSWTDRRTGDHDRIWTAQVTAKKSKLCSSIDLVAAGKAVGAAEVDVPTGTTETRLTLWRRPDGGGGDPLTVYVDELDGAAPPADAILVDDLAAAEKGAGPALTIVDLDRACDAVTGTKGGCAGHRLTLRLGAIDPLALGPHVEDATVTTCAR